MLALDKGRANSAIASDKHGPFSVQHCASRHGQTGPGCGFERIGLTQRVFAVLGSVRKNRSLDFRQQGFLGIDLRIHEIRRKATHTRMRTTFTIIQSDPIIKQLLNPRLPLGPLCPRLFRHSPSGKRAARCLSETQ